VEQVEIEVAVGHIGRVGQAGHGVFGGEAGDVISGLHRLAHRSGGEIGGGRVAAFLAQVHRDAQRLVAVALHVLQLALAHRHAQAGAFGHLGGGIGRAELSGVRQGEIDQFFKLAAGVLETGERGVGRA